MLTASRGVRSPWQSPHNNQPRKKSTWATQVLGVREKALGWLGKSIRALDYCTPISMLADAAGHERVLTILGGIEHGVP
jgi:uncharacterized protein (DUF2384 family)